MLLNCASQEYFGSVDRKALKLDVIEPVFLERKAGVEKIISFYAKKARGAMARFAIDNRIDTLDGVKDFNVDGYEFQPAQSDGHRLLFVRDAPT